MLKAERRVSLEGLCCESDAPTCTRRPVGAFSPHLVPSERGFMRTPMRACHVPAGAGRGSEGWCLCTLKKSKGQRQGLKLPVGTQAAPTW